MGHPAIRRTALNRGEGGVSQIGGLYFIWKRTVNARKKKRDAKRPAPMQKSIPKGKHKKASAVATKASKMGRKRGIRFRSPLGVGWKSIS